MDIEKKVKNTLKKINLNKKEKIIVALSGGKDSTVVAYLLKKFGYNIEGFHINLKIKGYSDRCLEAVKELCSQLNIKLHLYDIQKEMGSSMCYLRSGIQSRVKGIKNCAICGVIKKWIINKEIKKIKADKIATGHNLDDEAQTFLINIFKGSPELSANLGAISKNLSSAEGFVPRIKPLFYVPEDEIRKYSRKMKLPVVYEKCPCALDSYRIQVRGFLNTLSNKDKENIIKNFEKLDDRIQKTKDIRISYCEICKEPCRGKICKKCQLMRI